jgi:hypothetical protein
MSCCLGAAPTGSALASTPRINAKLAAFISFLLIFLVFACFLVSCCINYKEQLLSCDET